jgi:hypothetical protein
MSKVAHRIEVAGRARGVEAVDVEVDPVRPQEGAVDLRHRGRQRPVSGRVLRVIGGGQERPPPGLLDGRGVAFVETGHGAEAVCRHRRRVDSRDRPPEQIVVLRVHHRDLRVGPDEVDHGGEPGRLEQVEATGGSDIADVRVRAMQLLGESDDQSSKATHSPSPTTANTLCSCAVGRRRRSTRPLISACFLARISTLTPALSTKLSSFR